MTPKFAWQSSFMGTVDYMVTDETGIYRASLRQSVSEYELSIANGDEVRRDMRGGIGLLVRGVEPIPAATVAAFNAWRLAEHTRQIAQIDAQPDRYGVLAPDDSLRRPPMVARAAEYVTGRGWIPVVAWKASDHDAFWYGLECLPPALQTAVGFLVGEPYSHRDCRVTGKAGVPTFTAFAECGGAYFKATEPVTRAEFVRVCAATVIANVVSEA